MSNNALILERTADPAVSPAPVLPVHSSGEYLDLIRRHFHPHSAVAIVPAGAGRNAADVCENIAAELAVSGNRVVIVSVDALLRMNPVATPHESDCIPGRIPKVWRWPSAPGTQIQLSKSRVPDDPPGNWLDSLRLTFDAVLLDCPAAETAPAAAQLAALADVAVLVVEAGRTTRQQIQRDQRALQSRGVKLAGCILMECK
jgi:Mrp family chromosome partitioning ATPase